MPWDLRGRETPGQPDAELRPRGEGLQTQGEGVLRADHCPPLSASIQRLRL